MASAESHNLSASLEDYLEAILNLERTSNVARSRDIAKLLGVSKSSVTGALRVLKKKGLANYEPYDYVTLTDSGQAVAQEIAKKHDVLTSFFVDVLGVEAEAAQRAACEAEHALGSEIISRLLCFIEYMTESGKNGRDVAGEFGRFCEKRLGNGEYEPRKQMAIDSTEEKRKRPLSTVKAGETVRVAGVVAGRDLNNRLASMGLVPNVEIKVMSNQHPGPFVISVKESRMMLGRGMAQKIMVL
ncbi:MAG: metal-dependent transcriptional regulator [Phycisphaerales bacterium]|nr:MAG: metal-dependent transcriptional regulator [Phycisphaerales bacterium]